MENETTTHPSPGRETTRPELKEWARLAAARDLEDLLGSPGDPSSELGHRRCLERDEQDEYPAEACRILIDWGLQHHFIPVEQGGKLASLEELSWLFRIISRRDPTVATCMIINFISGTPVWVAGSPAQKRRMAELLESGAQLSFVLTERAHGSDLLACETYAAPAPEGYLLTGEKWLIGNGNHSSALTLFARTDPRGGPGGFSMFLLEKAALPLESWSCLPPEKLLGLRGLDLSGLRFEACAIARESLIGQAGHGLEDLLGAQQIARTVICSLCLGAGDSALRATLSFARSRILYGKPITALFDVRSKLATSFAQLVACECTLTAALRAIHLAPEQLSVWSAAVKVFAPGAVQAMLHELSVVMGARYYLRDHPEYGILQKLLRDSPVFAVAESSTLVNLKALATQLPALARRRLSLTGDPALEQRLRSIFSLEDPLPELDVRRLSLLSRGGDDALTGLSFTARRIRDEGASDAVAPETREYVATLAERFLEVLKADEAELARWSDARSGSLNRHPEAFALAGRYATLHAAACCLLSWIFRPAETQPFFAKGDWLALCLNAMLQSMQRPLPSPPRSCLESVAEDLVKMDERSEMFSLLKLEVA